MIGFDIGELRWNRTRTAAVQRVRVARGDPVGDQPRKREAAYTIWKLWAYDKNGELYATRYSSGKLALKARTKLNGPATARAMAS